MKKSLLLVVIGCLSILSTFGANYKADEIIVVKSATLGDYYLAGKDITISTIIFGDIIAASENFWIKDSVRGDLLIGAAKINLDGYIGDDARLSAGEIVINSRIEGDLIVFAGNVRVTESASIGGNVVCYAGKITLNGNVGGHVIASGGEIKLENTIGGYVEIKGGEVFFNAQVMGPMELAGQKITLGSNASCAGDVTYWNGDGELDFSGIASSAIYNEDLAIADKGNDWSSIVKMMGLGIIAYWIVFIISAFLVILVLEYLFGKYFDQASIVLSDSLIKSFGFGMLFFLGVPVLTVVLLLSLIGIPLGAFTLSIYLLALLFSSTITGMMAAHYFKNKSSKDWTYMETVFYSLITVVILKVIFSIPFVGSILKKIAAAFAYGALMLMATERKG